MEYISLNFDYDVNLIKNSVERYEKAGRKIFKIEEARDFCARYENVYIYGNGGYAKEISSLLADIGIKIHGTLVTKKENEEDVIEYTRGCVQSSEGVIIGVSKKYYKEILDVLLADLCKEQILSLNY